MTAESKENGMSEQGDVERQLEQFRELFRTEAAELIEELEVALLDFEEDLGNRDLVDRIFRTMHTIKGSGSMHGLEALAEFTHHLETAWDRVRSAKLEPTSELVELSLMAKDHIRSLIEGEADSAAGTAIVVRLGQLGATGSESAEAKVEDAAESESAARPRTYRVRFRPHSNVFMLGCNPLPLVREACALGDGIAVIQTDDMPTLADMDPESCYVAWDIVLTTEATRDEIRDVFIFVEDRCELDVRVVDEPESSDTPIDYMKMGDILVERGDLSQEELELALADQKRAGEIMQEKGLVSQDKIRSALAEQEAVRQSRKRREGEAAATNIRVPAARLDDLVDLVGELVIAQARLSQVALDRQDPVVQEISEDLQSLTSELQDNAMSLRMLPIGSTFSKMRRLVRDLSSNLGKQVELVTSGGETELDKTVIERLGDPMVHLIRNCVDHGLESPEGRLAAGKSESGTVHLSAEHSQGHVIIKIEDDGAGIDAEVIRAKAVERGLITADQRLSESRILELVFAPGFSTAQEVSNVSGRGVGMDVVKRSVDELRGTISVDSEVGRGTTVIVRLPLTLAIVEVLRVRIGGEAYMMPLSLVEECVELTAEDVQRNHGREILEVRDHLVPFVRLREFFSIEGGRPPIEQVVIASLESGRYGFVVDQVVGQVQAVMKNLGKLCEDARGLAGATILGDGTVALIIDPSRIVHHAKLEAGPSPSESLVLMEN